MEPAAEVLSEHSARCLRRLGFRCHTGTCRVTTGVLYGGLARDTIDLAGPFWQQLGPGALGYFGEVAADWCDGVAAVASLGSPMQVLMSRVQERAGFLTQHRDS
ncbi:unnamed protein product [Gadus morhua 'NCC']